MEKNIIYILQIIHLHVYEVLNSISEDNICILTLLWQGFLKNVLLPQLKGKM